MDEPELKIIDVFICKLRKKLANASQGKNYIETVWGRGYVIHEGDPEKAFWRVKPLNPDTAARSSARSREHGKMLEARIERLLPTKERVANYLDNTV